MYKIEIDLYSLCPERGECWEQSKDYPAVYDLKTVKEHLADANRNALSLYRPVKVKEI